MSSLIPDDLESEEQGSKIISKIKLQVEEINKTSSTWQQHATVTNKIQWDFMMFLNHFLAFYLQPSGKTMSRVFPRFIPTYLSHTWLCFHFCRGSSTLGGSIGYVLAASHASDPPLLPKKRGKTPGRFWFWWEPLFVAVFCFLNWKCKMEMVSTGVWQITCNISKDQSFRIDFTNFKVNEVT